MTPVRELGTGLAWVEALTGAGFWATMGWTRRFPRRRLIPE